MAKKKAGRPSQNKTKPHRNGASNTRRVKAVMQKRVEEVLNMRLYGAQFHDIVNHSREQNWNVSETQIWRYIRAANELLANEMEEKRPELIRRHQAQVQRIFMKAFKSGDLRVALDCLKEEAELFGLNTPKPKDNSGTTINVGINIEAPEQRAARIVEAIDAELAQRNISEASSDSNGIGHANNGNAAHYADAEAE